MKIRIILLLSGLLLWGCSQKQSSPAGSVIDLIQAGKDVTLKSGAVLHVGKREGALLEGVTFSARLPTGRMETLSADTATLSSETNAPGEIAWMITLHDAKANGTAVGEFPIALGK